MPRKLRAVIEEEAGATRSPRTRRAQGKLNRNKGAQEERDVVNWWIERGFEAGRKRLSGGMEEGKWGTDTWLMLPLGEKLEFEVKLRSGKAFAAGTLVKWLGEADILSTRKAGSTDRYVFMPMDTMEKILQAQALQRTEIRRLMVELAKLKGERDG